MQVCPEYPSTAALWVIVERGADVGANVRGNNKQPLAAARVAAAQRVTPNDEVRGLASKR